MTAPTHILTGLASVVVVGHVVGVTPDGVGLLAFLAGSLAPDIDGAGVITRPGTILRQLIGRGLATLIDVVFEFIAAIIGTLFGHRGFIHSPVVALAFIGAGMYGDRSWLVWFGGGYMAHILGDAMTFSGVPLLSPMSSERFSFSDMVTGSGEEGAVAVVLLLFVCVFGWALLPDAVRHTHAELYELIANSLV